MFLSQAFIPLSKYIPGPIVAEPNSSGCCTSDISERRMTHTPNPEIESRNPRGRQSVMKEGCSRQLIGSP